MSKQFDRKYKLVVGYSAVLIEHNDIEFEVIRSLSEEPNVASISVYGLSEKTVKKVIGADTPPVTFSAGYKDTCGTIFVGDARDCYAEYLDVDSILRINSGDTERALRNTRINKTFRAGTPVVTVLAEILKILNVKPGNLTSKFSALTLIEGSAQYVNGITLSGNAGKALSRVCRSCNLQYSIQNGTLQALYAKEPLLEKPVILIKKNLIGVPEIGSDGAVKFTTLLDSEIKPGRLISLQGQILRAERVRYFGSSAPGTDWYTEIEGHYQ